MQLKELVMVKENLVWFQNFLATPSKFENLFVITHLGQLKQMESLIAQKNIKDNVLVILYTTKNLDVPANVANQVSSQAFERVILLEIPYGVNQQNFKKLKSVEISYLSLIGSVTPKKLYLNSFEGHYSILLSIARKQDIRRILVEEGTATYKLNLKVDHQDQIYSEKINYKFLKKEFMATVGETQIFKKMIKYYKYNQDLFNGTQNFFINVKNSPRVKRKIVEYFGGSNLRLSGVPFTAFDKAYVSYPNLIESSFNIMDVEKFSLYDFISPENLSLAKNVINEYGISKHDVLYVSQRYAINPSDYVKTVIAILSAITETNQRVFIKLHPKETQKVFEAFKAIAFASKGKFILIESNQFLIEPVIKVSQIERVIGLTSTVLVYAPLVSSQTKSISIANAVIKYMPSTPENRKGLDIVIKHLEILKVFENIEFV